MEKKKMLGVLLVAIISVIGIYYLSAASNRVKIVTTTHGPNPLGSDAFVVNTIDEAKTNLVDGKVAIDVTIDNSKSAEVIYAFNNDSNLNAIKTDLINNVVSKANALTGNAVTQGVIYTTGEGVSYDPLVDAGIDAKLNTVKTVDASATDASKLKTLINNATNSFTSADNKYLVLFTGTLPSLSSDEVNDVKTLVTSMNTKNIKLIIYSISSTDTESSLVDIFGNGNVVKVDQTGGVINYSLIDFNSDVTYGATTAKQDVNMEILFDDFIYNNFNIEDIVVSKGSAIYDNETHKIVVTEFDLASNEDFKLTYNLQVKSKVDADYINKNLRTNKQIRVSMVEPGNVVTGTYPADNRINEDECSPIISILEEAITNPKTGVFNYIIIGACLMAVALATLIVMNNKKEFNRI